MKIYSILPFIISVFLLFLCAFVYSRNRRNLLNSLFALLCFASSVWLFFYSLAYSQEDTLFAARFFKLGYSGVIFIAVIAFHYTLEFLHIRKLTWLIRGVYAVGVFWVSILWTSGYLIKSVKSFFWGYYPQAGILHPLFLVFFIGFATAISAILLYFFLRKSDVLSARQISQIKYLFLALFVYNFAAVDFLPNYGLS